MSASSPGRAGRIAAFLGSRRGALIALAVIIGVFLLVGVAWSLVPHTSFHRIKGDGFYYEALAKRWLQRGVYSYQSMHPNAWRTPGFPVFLAAVYWVTGYWNRYGGPYQLLYYIQLLFAACSIGLTYLVGFELLKSRRAGLLAALLVAAYPATQQSAIPLLTEPLSVLLFLGYVYVQLLALRKTGKWWWLTTGILFAAAVMVRPGLALIGVVPVLYLFFTTRDRKRLLLQAALLAAGFAIVVAPWFIRNVVTLHQPVVLAEQTGDPVLAGADPYYYQIGPNYELYGPSYEAFNKLISAPDHPHISKMDYALETIWSHLQRQPVQTVAWFTVGKLTAMFTRLFASGSGGTIQSWAWVVHLVIVVFGAFGMFLSIRMRRLRLVTLMIIVGVVSLLPYVPEPRYVFPFIPLLAVLASGTILLVWNAARDTGTAAVEPASE